MGKLPSFDVQLACDFRSDTLTQPTDEMRKFMLSAKVGDDVFDEDPTVHALEAKVANMLEKEASLFFPSGCMANLTALLSHTNPGSAMFTGAHSHIRVYELGSYSRIAGLHLCPVPDDNNVLHIQTMVDEWVDDAYHLPKPGLITAENTQNILGGLIYPLSHFQELSEFAKARQVPLHLDGARLFHAGAGSGHAPQEWSRLADSVMVCLSKGLGAPVGSMLVGSQAMINKARVFRKMLGGGMRQVGILAAAGLFALDHHLPLLELDVKRCRHVHSSLKKLAGISLSRPDSNILVLSFEDDVAEALVQFLGQRGIGSLNLDAKRVRFVFHFQNDDRSVENLIQGVQAFYDSCPH